MTRRGAVHTLDAFLAAVIIAMALLYASRIPRERNYLEQEPLRALGMQVLVRLDGNGTLGGLVDDQGWDELESALRIALPTGLSFNLTVLDEQGTVLNDHPITNGGLLGRRIESVEYMTAATSGACTLYRFRLQLGG